MSKSRASQLKTEAKQLTRRGSLSHFEAYCNEGIHHHHEIRRSQCEFGWKIVDAEDDNDWSKWHSFGLDVKFEYMDIDWKNLCDMEFSWTGVCKMQPGAYLPLHIHDPPEFYYILKGRPTVVLNGIYNKCKPIQCVTIPPRCPHKIFNDTNEEVIFIYTYLPLNDVCTKDQLGWVFLEDVTPNIERHSDFCEGGNKVYDIASGKVKCDCSGPKKVSESDSGGPFSNGDGDSSDDARSSSSKKPNFY